MNQSVKKYFELLKNDQSIFLNFLKAKYPLFHNSNFFFRDFQYGIKRYLEKKEIFVNYSQAEKLAVELSKYFESIGIFVRTNKLAWRINDSEFITQNPGDPF